MTSVLNVLTYIITSITARPIKLALILVILSVSTFIITVILYIKSHDGQNIMFIILKKTKYHINIVQIIKCLINPSYK